MSGMNSKVLCFNIAYEQWQAVQAAARESGADCIAVPQADFSQCVGALIGVLPKTNTLCLSPFSEPMLIMSGFTQAQTDIFLAALRARSITIPYKAVVTPTNLMWQCDALIRELIQEHEQIRRMAQKNE